MSWKIQRTHQSGKKFERCEPMSWHISQLHWLTACWSANDQLEMSEAKTNLVRFSLQNLIHRGRRPVWSRCVRLEFAAHGTMMIAPMTQEYTKQSTKFWSQDQAVVYGARCWVLGVCKWHGCHLHIPLRVWMAWGIYICGLVVWRVLIP